jgi:hypothetical protein
MAGALAATVTAADVRASFPRDVATFVRPGSGRIEPTTTPAAPTPTNTVILRTTNPAQLMTASDSAASDFNDRCKCLTNNYGMTQLGQPRAAGHALRRPAVHEAVSASSRTGLRVAETCRLGAGSSPFVRQETCHPGYSKGKTAAGRSDRCRPRWTRRLRQAGPHRRKSRRPGAVRKMVRDRGRHHLAVRRLPALTAELVTCARTTRSRTTKLV